MVFASPFSPHRWGKRRASSRGKHVYFIDGGKRNRQEDILMALGADTSLQVLQIFQAKCFWMKLRTSYNAGEFTGNGSFKRSNSLSRVVEEDDGIEKNGISEVLITINGYLQGGPTYSSAACKSWTICRVPNSLRGVHENGFDPKFISIGPFHRQKRHLKAMEEHKKRLLLRLLNSTNKNCATLERESSTSTQDVNQIQNGTTPESILSQKQDETLTNAKAKSLVDAMEKLEPNARACYSETCDNISPNEFVLMMLLDGCFVVELLRLYAECEKENDDPIFTTRWMVPSLQRDLLLLENQLPYFVLEKIFEMTSAGEETFSLSELTLKFFDPLLPRDKKLLENCIVDAKPDHLLGLFRFSFLTVFKDRKSSIHQVDHRRMKASGAINVPPPVEVSQSAEESPIEDRQLIHCATELKEAGIVFRKRENHDLLDIEFKDGKLFIPHLHIDDHSGPVFINFVAYEQCDRFTEPYFTHYLLFFDSLVNSSKDVEHLHMKGIIDHVLGCDEDVADLFNKLCKEVVHDVDDYYLSKPLKDVNRCFRIKRYRWGAKWKHDNFSSPWAFTSFLAAIILLLLTGIQTFFTVFPYFHPTP